MRAKRIGIFPCADRPPPTPYGQADAKKSLEPSLACQRDCIRAAGQILKAETNRVCTTRPARLLSLAPDSVLRVRPRSIAWYETAKPLAQANYGLDSIAIPMVSLSIKYIEVMQTFKAAKIEAFAVSADNGLQR